MRRFRYSAFALAAAMTLAACGGGDDASEDAAANNVEVPADEAMAGVPEPVADEYAVEDAADEASGPERDALQAAEEAEAAVNADIEAAIGDAEAAIE